MNSYLLNDVEALKEEMVTSSTSYLTTTQEYSRVPRRYITKYIRYISQNRQDISSNLSKSNYLSDNRITAIEQDITDISKNRITSIRQEYCRLRRYHHEHGHLLFVVV